MHSRISWTVIWSLLVICCLFCPQATAQQVFNKFKADLRSFGKEALVRIRPKTGKDTQIELLAREIDWLEAHIDKFGSVVAKQPDIWGESRLTKYRSEFENEMVKRLGCFEVRDNASISRSDLAFLASATGISAAITGEPTEPVVTTNMNVSSDSTTNTVDATGERPPTPDVPSIDQDITIGRTNFPATQGSANKANTNLDIVEELNQQARFINHLQQLRRINSGDDTSDAPGYALNLVRIPVSVNPGRETRRGYGARVTITASLITGDALLPETFRNLVVNDIVDQLALPILKLAEDPMLEFTRRAQIFHQKYDPILERIDQTVDRIKGMPPADYQIAALLAEMFQQASTDENLASMRALSAEAINALKLQQNILREQIANSCPNEKVELEKTLKNSTYAQYRIYQSVILTHFVVLDELCELGNQGLECRRIEADFASYLRSIDFETGRLMPGHRALDEQYLNVQDKVSSIIKAAQGRYNFAEGELTGLADQFPVDDLKRILPLEAVNLFEGIYDNYFEAGQASVNPVSRRRRSTMPIPQVLLESVISRDALVEIALRFSESYRGQMVAWNERQCAPKFHLADVRHYLQGNLDMAYRLLMQQENRELIRNIIEPGLTPSGMAVEIDLAHLVTVEEMRKHMMTQLYAPGTSYLLNDRSRLSRNPPIIQSLAWPVLVEIALLNEQLNKDVRAIAATRNDCGCLPSTRNAYYLPMPEEQITDSEFDLATQQFQEYVRCRWPIHVFHVDPVNQDQNVSASSLVQRELAIAVAWGVASGTVNVRQANQFVRQFQESITTVELNRTVAGFSHGSDTFGWEFRPRIQITPNRSTLAAFGESLFGRFADAPKRDAEIEPGIRECTAIVLMPSFVPYCDFDVSTNWFRLDNPRSTEISTHATMKLSRSIRKMQDCALSCSECAHLYRDGETERLLKRVAQLENQLPLQSMRAQIPYENTLGGFEMFSNGVTDLSPELVGWYGAPGVYISGDENCFCCSNNCQANPDSEDSCVRPASATEEGSGNRNAKICSVDPPGSVQGSGTSIFVVGDNFSVHETRFIAGGVAIPADHVKLISRQVVEINIPTCVATVILDKKEFVAVYASTPYGVTSHLHIPVVKDETKTGCGTCTICCSQSVCPQQPVPANGTTSQTTNADPSSVLTTDDED